MPISLRFACAQNCYRILVRTKPVNADRSAGIIQYGIITSVIMLTVKRDEGPKSALCSRWKQRRFTFVVVVVVVDDEEVEEAEEDDDDVVA